MCPKCVFHLWCRSELLATVYKRFSESLVLFGGYVYKTEIVESIGRVGNGNYHKSVFGSLEIVCVDKKLAFCTVAELNRDIHEPCRGRLLLS